jgi:tetratricopeptide (TPR) repeat protein
VPFLVRAGARDKRLFANDEAILNFSRAVELAPDDVEIQLELADLYELVGRYDEALAAYEAVREATKDVRAYRGIAATLRKRGEYQAALAILDEAFATEELKGEDQTMLWSEQGRTLELAGHLREAADVQRAGLGAAGDRRPTGVGQLLFQLARVETVQGEFEEGLDHALQAEAIFREHSDLRGLASTMRVLGDTYRFLGRLDEAAAALQQGLELAERAGNVEEIGGCLMNLGIVEATRGANDAALVCFRRAVHELEQIGHASGRATAYSNLAYMLALNGEYEEALAYCDRALELARSIGHSGTIALTYDTMATIALAQGDLEEAIAKAEEAAALHLELGAVPDAVSALETASAACERSGAAERAHSLRERARKLTVSIPTR